MAKSPGTDHLLQILIGGGNDPNIGRNLTRAAHPIVRHMVQHA